MWRLLVLALWLCACGPSSPGLEGGRVDAGLAGDAGASDAGEQGAFDGGGRFGPSVTIRVHYPAGTRTIFLRGNRAPLSWTSGVPMQPVGNDVWQLTVGAVDADFEVKPLLDDATWAKGPNWAATLDAGCEVYPRFLRDVGEVRLQWPTLASPELGNSRRVWVYVPPTSLENASYRAPVVYMHDGRNLFDDALAFGGVSWGVDETMNAGAADGTLAEALVVGIDSTDARINEYTPTSTTMYGGGRGDAYLRFVVNVVKPRVEAEFNVATGPENTAMLGSSLGGLISAYAGVSRPGNFGLIGAMSPSTWWDNRIIVTRVTTQGAARPVRVYVDSGDSGLENDGVTDTRALADAYRQVGYVDGVTLRYVVQAGGTHTEAYWAQRLPGALRFLLGPRR